MQLSNSPQDKRGVVKLALAKHMPCHAMTFESANKYYPVAGRTTAKARGHGVLVDREQKLDAPRHHTNFFAKSSKLHKFATANSNFEKIDYFRHAPHNVDVYQFSAKSGY